MWETEMWARSLGQEDALEKEMATHGSIFAWEILEHPTSHLPFLASKLALVCTSFFGTAGE